MVITYNCGKYVNNWPDMRELFDTSDWMFRIVEYILVELYEAFTLWTDGRLSGRSILLIEHRSHGSDGLKTLVKLSGESRLTAVGHRHIGHIGHRNSLVQTSVTWHKSALLSSLTHLVATPDFTDIEPIPVTNISGYNSSRDG